MGYLVYIVSHRGPYAEKAADQKFYLDKLEAEERAEVLRCINAPAGYKVYEMILSACEEEEP